MQVSPHELSVHCKAESVRKVVPNQCVRPGDYVSIDSELLRVEVVHGVDFWKRAIDHKRIGIAIESDVVFRCEKRTVFHCKNNERRRGKNWSEYSCAEENMDIK